jgi:pimeloyl-ACP methyl ester carboxylesterase
MAALEPAPRPRFAPLRVPGFRDAVVALPATVNGPRPLIVAVHGNYDRPEWHCELWRSVTGARGFVLCPRGQPQPAGKPSEDRWTYGWNPFDVEREIDAALRALRSEYGDEVDDGPAVYAGFSLGAIFGSGLIRRNPKRFARAVLIEGGAADWSLEAAKLYAIGGGQRVLFVCGQAACPSETIAPRVWLEMAHVKARTAYETSVGHTYDGPVAGLIARSWDWVVEGDERWSRTQ